MNNKCTRLAFPTNLNWFVKNVYFTMHSSSFFLSVVGIVIYCRLIYPIVGQNIGRISMEQILESILNTAKNQC